MSVYFSCFKNKSFSEKIGVSIYYPCKSFLALFYTRTSSLNQHSSHGWMQNYYSRKAAAEVIRLRIALAMGNDFLIKQL